MTHPDRELLDEQVAYYRARAAEYDATSMPDGDPFAVHAQAIRSALVDLGSWGRVLEIAAGTGQWTGMLADRADELLVTDAAPEMIDLARSKVGERPNVRYAVAEAFALRPSHTFDTVFFGFFLSHVPLSLFEAFWRVLESLLAPGGRVVFVDEGVHAEWHEDWIDASSGIVRRPLSDGSVHRAVKVHWQPIELEARLLGLGWDASVTEKARSTGARHLTDSCPCNYRCYHGHMPAITVDEISVLPHLPVPDPTAGGERAVLSVTRAPRGFEGEGFPVRRAFHGVDLGALDPFIHMDQMGEVEYGPGEPKGTPWHPHRGFETVTYIMDGTFEHSDSNGGGGVITNGDTQWMTAGAGILHIEKPPESLVVSGGLFHGIQLWVNLPKAQKWSPPRYQDIRAREVGLLASADGGALLRVIAGELAGHAGPGVTHTPMTLVHATLAPEAELVLPWRPDYNALVYVLAGHGTAGSQRTPVQTGQLVAYGPGSVLRVAASRTQESRSPNLDVLVLGGRPIREPIAWAGPFVMNTRDEVMTAFDDYQAGRLGSIPAVHGAPTTLTESEPDHTT